MRNNKKSKIFSLAVLASMLMPITTSCDNTTTTTNSTQNDKNLPESVYKDVGVAFEDQTFSYDGTEKVLTCDEKSLPSGVSVTYENNKQIQVGSFVVTAHFTASDGQTLYKDKTARLTIKAPVDTSIDWYSLITFNSQTVDYDGDVHTLKIEDETIIPEGFTLKYTNNDNNSDAGIYTVSANVINLKTGKVHYTAQATLTIKKKDFNLETIKQNLKFNANSVTRDNSGDITCYFDYFPSTTHILQIQPDSLDKNLKAYLYNNQRSETGSQKVTIYFESLNDNYNSPQSITVTMAVKVISGYRLSFYRNNTEILNAIDVVSGQNCPQSAESLIAQVQALSTSQGYTVSLSDTEISKLNGVTENRSIYFTFTANEYKVKYSLSNFKENNNITTYTYNVAPTTENGYNLVTPVVDDGYYFEGWYLKPDYSSSSRIISLGSIASDITVYGHVIKNTTTIMSFSSKSFVYDGASHSLSVTGSIPSTVNITYTYYLLDYVENGTDDKEYKATVLGGAPSDVGVYKVEAKFFDQVGTKYCDDMVAFMTITEKTIESNMSFVETSFDYNTAFKTYPTVTNIPENVTVKYVYYTYESTTLDDGNVKTTMYTYDTTLTDAECDDTTFNTLPVEPGNYLVDAIFTTPDTYDDIATMHSYLTINKLDIVLDKNKVFPDETKGYVEGEECQINVNTSAIPTDSDGRALATVYSTENNVRTSVGSQIATAYFVAVDQKHYNNPAPLTATLTVTQNNSHTVKFFYVSSFTESGDVATLTSLSQKQVADNSPAAAPIVDKKSTTDRGGLKFVDSSDPSVTAFFNDDYYNAFEQKWFPCDDEGHIVSTESNIENVTADTNFILTYIPRQYAVDFVVENGTDIKTVKYVAYHPYYSKKYASVDNVDKDNNIYNGFYLPEVSAQAATPNTNYEFKGWTDENTVYDKNAAIRYVSSSTIGEKNYTYAYGNHTLTADIRGKFNKIVIRAEIDLGDGTPVTYKEVDGTDQGVYVRYGTKYSTDSYDAEDLKQLHENIAADATLGYDFPTTGATVDFTTYAPTTSGDTSLYQLYTFLGYFDELGNSISIDSICFAETTQNIYLKFSIKKVTVTFLYLNGGENTSSTWNYSQTLGKNKTATEEAVIGINYLPSTPSRTGYTFLGWTYKDGAPLVYSRNLDGSLPETTYSSADPSKIFIVGYEGNTALKLSDSKLFRVVNGVSFPDTITLSAIWVKDQVTVQYQTQNSSSDPTEVTDSDGMEFSYDSTKKISYSDTFGDAAPTLKAESYNFLGWYYGDQEITSSTTLDFIGPNNTIILVSKWETIDYEITYILNNNDTNSTTVQTIKYDTIFALPDFNAPVGCTSYDITIYDLKGNKVESFIMSNKDEDMLKENNLVNKTFKQLGLHESFVASLEWYGEDVYVSFKDEDGLSDVSSKDDDGNLLKLSDRHSRFAKTYGETYDGGTWLTQTLPTPYKAGYDFGGWFYGATRITDSVTITSSDSSLPTIEVGGVTYKNIILKARWLAKTYNVTLSPNNGSNSQSISVSYKGTFALPFNYTKTGYVLNGWIDDNGIVYTNNFTYAFTNDLNLRANWVAKTYTVQYYDVNGALKATRTVNYGQKLNEVLNSNEYSSFFPSTNYNEGGTSYSSTAYAVDKTVPQFTLDSGSIINLNTYVCNQDLDNNSIIRVTAYGKARTFTIVFDMNRQTDIDGLTTGDSSADIATVMAVTYGQPFTPLSAPTRKGFTFVSWSYKHVFDAANKVYGDLSDDETIDFSAFNQMTDLIATAQWKAVSYKVTFNYYNGLTTQSELYQYTDEKTGALTSSVYVGTKIDVPKGDEKYVPKHYRFMYWQNERDETFKLYSDTEYVFDDTQDMTFRAVYVEAYEDEYQKLKTHLIFKSNGVTIREGDYYCGEQISFGTSYANASFKYGTATLTLDSMGMVKNPFTRFDDVGNDRSTVENAIILTAAPTISDFSVDNATELLADHISGSTFTINISFTGSNLPTIDEAIADGTLKISSSNSSICQVYGRQVVFSNVGEVTITVTVNNLKQTFTITVVEDPNA